MTASLRQPEFADAHRIGVLGDIRGDLDHMLTVSDTLWSRGVGVLLSVGTFGFVSPVESGAIDLDVISTQLRAHRQALFFVEEHLDRSGTLATFPASTDGLRWVRPNIAHIPGGYRSLLRSGAGFAAVDGANAIDRFKRGPMWRPEETITDADLAALGDAHVDILVGHDAPTPLPSLDAALAATGHPRPGDPLDHRSRAGREQLHRRFLRMRPKLYLGRHESNHFIDETVTYGEGEDTFETRVILLSASGTPQTSQAIVNVHTHDVALFRRDDTTVTELNGTELGRWKVTTERSHYIFDFFAHTVTRYPGGTASASINDTTRPLRMIECCRIGERGHWTMHNDGGPAHSIEYYWQVSTEIRSIKRIADPTTPQSG